MRKDTWKCGFCDDCPPFAQMLTVSTLMRASTWWDPADPAHSIENRTQLIGAKLRTSPRDTLCLSSPLITSNQQKPNP